LFAPQLARWLSSIGAVIAIVAQLSLALAPFGEARERSSTAAHVELGGTSTHYAHNDATCAVCQARSLQALSARTPDALLTGPIGAITIVAVADRFIAAELHSLSNPRAPPRCL